MNRFLIVLLLLTQVAFGADDCATMNLINEPNSPFQKIPVYDQDGASICYAYAAAQLIDYHLVKNGQNRSVHPLWAALKYAEYKDNDNISLGTTYHALQEIADKGNCHYEKVSSALATWAQKANAREPEIINLIELLAPKLQALHEEKTKGSSNPAMVYIPQSQVDSVIKEAIELNRPYCQAGTAWENILPELRSLSVMSSRKMLSSLILPVCNSDLQKTEFPEPQFFSSEKDGAYPVEIQKKLEALKAPVSVSYCSKFLSTPRYDGVDRAIKGGKNIYAKDCGGHESLIVGKKKIGNKCHLLLRNTWGAGFSKSTEPWKCLCKNKTTGEYVDDCTDALHNNGKFTVEGCWVSAEGLGKNAYGMSYLED